MSEDTTSGTSDTVTIYFPHDLLTDARAACETGESLDEFIVAAVERETQRRQGWAASEDIPRDS